MQNKQFVSLNEKGCKKKRLRKMCRRTLAGMSAMVLVLSGIPLTPGNVFSINSVSTVSAAELESTAGVVSEGTGDIAAEIAAAGEPGTTAETEGTICGPFTVTGGTVDTDYQYDSTDKILKILSDTPLTISGTATNKERIVVAGGINADITLNNVSIDLYEFAAKSGAPAFEIEDNSTGNVTIRLEGTNSLNSGTGCAGLQKNNDDSVSGTIGMLTITGTGTLTAIGGDNGAGIGGGDGKDGSAITISGGTVKATGERYAAGIGGGKGGVGHDITISNGEVTANSLTYGAGIGGGDGGAGHDITISGGKVIAACGRSNYYGSCNGAGIGGGIGGDGYNITISGGIVEAESRDAGAGIGGGGTRANAGSSEEERGGSGRNIVISGGQVTAVVGSYGVGIGGGRYNTGGNSVTISGGVVTAKGGMYGAGIGGGYYGGTNDILIEGGTVNATGGQYGAGIGGGNNQKGDTDTITIRGGIVTATGGDRAAGIGGGNYGNVTNRVIKISGGTVTAKGGNYGIGGGSSENGTNVTFTTKLNDSENGSAFILARPEIQDRSNEDSWCGVIFKWVSQGYDWDKKEWIYNDVGKVYGTPILETNAEIPKRAQLTIEEGKCLTIGEGVTLANSGTITNNGTLTNNGTFTIQPGGGISGATGTLSGEGRFYTENLTEDMIIVPTDLVYDGSDLSDVIKERTRLEAPEAIEICGKPFTVNLENWGDSSVTKDSGNELLYTVTYTHADGSTVNKTVTLICSHLGGVQEGKCTLCGHEMLYSFAATADKSEAYDYGSGNKVTITTAVTGEDKSCVKEAKLFCGETEYASTVLADGDDSTSGSLSMDVKDLAVVDGQAQLTVKFYNSVSDVVGETDVTVSVNPCQHLGDSTPATCIQKALCDDCGQEYGDFGQHVYTSEIVSDDTKKSDATCTEPAKYYKSCGVCGEVSTSDADIFTDGEALGHIDGDNDGVCDREDCKFVIDAYRQLQTLMTTVTNNLSDGKYADVQYTSASIDKLRTALLNAKAITAETAEEEIKTAYDALLQASTVDEKGLIQADKNIVISFANSGSQRGIAEGNGWYANGDTVTLEVTPSVGYTFEKWTTDASGSNSAGTERIYSFTLNADSPDTYYAWLNEVKYTITFGDAVGGSAATDVSDGKYVYGAVVTVTATANENYAFVGWKDIYGTTVSTEAAYTFTVLGNTRLTPVFVQTQNDSGTAITYVTVNFYHQSGALLDSQKVVSEEGKITSTVTNPTKVGFDFLGWSEKQSGATEGDVIDFNNTTFNIDTNLYPVFQAQEITYELKVDGVASQKKPHSSVTVTADPILGKQFVGWKNAAGDIVSYDSTYTFIIAGDTELTSYYEMADAEIEKKPTINMSAPVYENITGGYKMTFYFDYTLPEDCTLIDIGTIKVKNTDLSADGITLDTADVSQYSVISMLGVDGQFYYSKSNRIGTGHTVAGYMIYEKNGIRYTVYSNALYGIRTN